jgi:hypothetical protein
MKIMLICIASLISVLIMCVHTNAARNTQVPKWLLPVTGQQEPVCKEQMGSDVQYLTTFIF